MQAMPAKHFLRTHRISNSLQIKERAEKENECSYLRVICLETMDTRRCSHVTDCCGHLKSEDRKDSLMPTVVRFPHSVL